MDFNQILDRSTPFDEKKLEMLDKITNVFYTTFNNNEVKFLFNYFFSVKLQIIY